MGVRISGFLADGAVPFHVRPPRELHARVPVEAVMPARNPRAEDPGYNAAATKALPRATAYQGRPGCAVARRWLSAVKDSGSSPEPYGAPPRGGRHPEPRPHGP